MNNGSERQQERDKWTECDSYGNRGRMSRPNQSCRPLLPFHPDNAPPSKVKTSPLTDPALPARLISTDYPFKCHYPPTLIQPKTMRWHLPQKPHNNKHSHREKSRLFISECEDPGETPVSPERHINLQHPSGRGGGASCRWLIEESEWHFWFHTHCLHVLEVVSDNENV